MHVAVVIAIVLAGIVGVRASFLSDGAHPRFTDALFLIGVAAILIGVALIGYWAHL